MYKKQVEFMTEKEVNSLNSDFPAGNDYICETAGFIPLDIKFKRFEQAGQVARLNASDFTSQDYRDMYQSPDFDIYPDDDLDDIEQKMVALQKHIFEVKKKVYERTVKEKMKNQVQEKPKTEEKSNVEDK